MRTILDSKQQLELNPDEWQKYAQYNAFMSNFKDNDISFLSEMPFDCFCDILDGNVICGRWIDINKDKPKIKELVLVAIDDKVLAGYLVESFSKPSRLLWNVNNWLYEFDEVTHWMKTPQLPKRRVSSK